MLFVISVKKIANLLEQRLFDYCIEIVDEEIKLIDRCISHNVKTNVNISHNPIKSPYTWTTKKTSLVELLRGIITTSAVNNGEVVIDEFILYFGRIFNIDLKNHRSLFHDIQERMENPDTGETRTTYLNKMATQLSSELLKLELKQR